MISCTIETKNVVETSNETSFFSKILNEIHANTINYMFNKYSNFSKIARILAYCFRSIKSINLAQPKPKFTPFPETTDLAHAKYHCIKFAQSVSLASLNSFFDETGLLRVGGRLINADIAYKMKHPINISRHHRMAIHFATEHHCR